MENTWKPSKEPSSEYSINIIECPLIFCSRLNWRREEDRTLDETGGRGMIRLPSRVLSCYKRLKKLLLLLNLKPFNPCFARKTYSRVWSPTINFVEKLQYMWKESSYQQEEVLIINYSFPEKMFIGISRCLVDHVVTWKCLLCYGSIKCLD